ncbi:MAG TPA: ferric reductase-like transmembrane domain-containing protein [Candidatus Norongarragalinales archaeon]|nr:ferric reductase-like transmembrane domain-containing protein [Candidatus Norongarragalinales archaeon]
MGEWSKAVGFSVLVFVVFQAGYASWNFSLEALGKVFALESVVLISLTFLIGSLSRYRPSWFDRFKPYRKALGVIGFALAALHVFFSLYLWFGFDFSMVLSSAKIVPILVGWVAFAIFSAMALLSDERWVKKLGFPLWKKIQRLGYLALALVLVHFFWMELKEGVFNVKPLGQAVFVLALVAILARCHVHIAGLIPRKPLRDPVRNRTRI